MWTLVLAAALVSQPATDLLGLAGSPPGADLPPGWRVRAVSGVPEPDFSIRELAEGRSLRVEGRGAAAWAYHELETPLAGEEGRLRWSWRTLEAPRGADLDHPGRDDAALRVYVVFGSPGPFGRARAIFYSWDGRASPARERPAFESARMAVVPVVERGARGDRWRSESVQPFRDYRRFWGGEPPPIRAVGVMQDTDDTGSSAAAELRALVWDRGPLPAAAG